MAVADRHRHLDDVDVNLLGVAERLRPDGLHDAAAAEQVRNRAHLVLDHGFAGVPVALERRRHKGADQPAVDEEHQGGRGALRLDARAQQRRAAHEGLGPGRQDAERGDRLRNLSARQRHGDEQGEEDGAHAGGHRPGDAGGVSGTSGPSAVIAAT